jgi:multiple sugar transport system substrate-binding protein
MSRSIRVLWSSIFPLLALLAGCPGADSGPKPQPGQRALAGVRLRLAVVDDPALAAAVERLGGEWNAQTGATLETVQKAEAQIAGAETLPADAVLCPSHLMGPLAERKLLAAVPPGVIHDPQWTGLFELLRLHETVWGKDAPMAIPFGTPLFCCYYRADLLERIGRRPPETWAEYEELAELLAKHRPSSAAAWCGTIEPLRPGWGGLLLLARAAPEAKHRDNYSTLFDLETMEPMVASPPFVEALERLAGAAKVGPADPLGCDPAAARAAFWMGQCGMAISWPTAADVKLPAKIDPAIRVGFVELPGSSRVFDVANQDWVTRTDEQDPHVSLLGVSGRLGVVSAKSPHVDAAFELLVWLADAGRSPPLSTASPATTLFCKADLKSPEAWVEKPVSLKAAGSYGATVAAALGREQWLGALCLPGRAEYLAALDAAVAAAVRGRKSPADALGEAAVEWRRITARLGLDRQRTAYRHSLGLE